MKKITIEKKDEEITYKNITTTHKFLVNGKEVIVYCYDKQDMEQSDYENDTSIDDRSLEALTEEEAEIFEEQLYDYLDMKEGEKLEADGFDE